MKKYFFAALTVFCASTAVAESRLVFSKDQRPVDGDLTELIIEQKDSLFDVTIINSRYSRPDRTTVESKKVVASGLECQISEEEVTCFRDDRPSDGSLVEVTVIRDRGSKYTATKRTVFISRQTREEVEKVDVLLTGLSLVSE